MRPLAFSTNAFKQSTLDEAVESIGAAGYAGVELMADLHHAEPTRLTDALKRDLKRRLADLGLLVSNLNAFTGFAHGGDTYHPTWLERDRAFLQRRVDHTRRVVALAAELGVGTVSLQPGGPVIGTGLSYADAGARFADALRPVVEDARGVGVALAVEPEPGLLLQTTGEYLAWKAAHFPGDGAVRMNCDVGHLFCVGEDPAAAIRSLPAGELAHVHLEDIAENRVHEHLCPGRGALDFASVFDALRAVGYAGHVTVELYPYETTAAQIARDALAHLRAVV